MSTTTFNRTHEKQANLPAFIHAGRAGRTFIFAFRELNFEQYLHRCRGNFPRGGQLPCRRISHSAGLVIKKYLSTCGCARRAKFLSDFCDAKWALWSLTFDPILRLQPAVCLSHWIKTWSSTLDEWMKKPQRICHSQSRSRICNPHDLNDFGDFRRINTNRNFRFVTQVSIENQLQVHLNHGNFSDFNDSPSLEPSLHLRSDSAQRILPVRHDRRRCGTATGWR